MGITGRNKYVESGGAGRAGRPDQMVTQSLQNGYAKFAYMSHVCSHNLIHHIHSLSPRKMDDSQEGKVTAQLITFEASAGAKGGSRGDNLSGSDKVALKKKKNREKQARYREYVSSSKTAPCS